MCKVHQWLPRGKSAGDGLPLCSHRLVIPQWTTYREHPLHSHLPGLVSQGPLGS